MTGTFMERKKTYYGVSIGILMVKSSFRRFRRRGKRANLPISVQYRIVEEAVPARITELHHISLLEPFKRAADELVEGGVDGIATTCGFLSIYQRELADHCGVPVATSSLLQVPMVERMLPSNKRVGILTYDGQALKGPYLEAVGILPDRNRRRTGLFCPLDRGEQLMTSRPTTGSRGSRRLPLRNIPGWRHCLRYQPGALLQRHPEPSGFGIRCRFDDQSVPCQPLPTALQQKGTEVFETSHTLLNWTVQPPLI